MNFPDYRDPFSRAKHTIYYAGSLNRKRQVINKLLEELHNSQLDMIDQAVECSDLTQAQEVIDRIKSL